MCIENRENVELSDNFLIFIQFGLFFLSLVSDNLMLKLSSISELSVSHTDELTLHCCLSENIKDIGYYM